MTSNLSLSLLAALATMAGDVAATSTEAIASPAIERVDTIRERYLEALGTRVPSPRADNLHLTQFPNFPNFPNFRNFPNFPNFPNWFNGWSNF